MSTRLESRVGPLHTSQLVLHPVQAADTPCKTQADSWQLELKLCELKVAPQRAQTHLLMSKAACFVGDTTQSDNALLLFDSQTTQIPHLNVLGPILIND